jgi:regulator of ribonuclease activity A
MHGGVSTVRCFEDNSRVKDAVESPGQGRILIVDGGGSRRHALFGGNLGKAAVRNGWAGVIIYGCIRDSAELGA